jgi:hypothetical protein
MKRNAVLEDDQHVLHPKNVYLDNETDEDVVQRGVYA